MAEPERLTAAAIERDGKIHADARSHYEIRRSLGDSNPQASNLLDREGFMTSGGRFITRDDAVAVGIASGQLSKRWENAGRKLLSSDINW